jgi:predicted O-methyltransferase YrrM
MDREKCLEDIFFTCKCYEGYWLYKTICAYQIPSEIKALLKEVKRNGASTILDIGTFDGGTLYLWTRFLEGQKIITIDLPFPYGYPSEKTKLFRLFNPNKELHFLRGSSFSNEIVDMVSNILKGDEIDLLFVDGDHSYEGVKKDFDQYKPFVRDGGIIAFHDIVSTRYGVSKFWNEVKHKYNSKEIIAPKQEMRAYARTYLDKQGWGGIGVLYI